MVDEGNHALPKYSCVKWVERAGPHQRPSVILRFGPSDWIVRNRKIEYRKGERKRLEKLGHVALEWFVSSQDQGGALAQDRIVEVFVIPKADGSIPIAPPHQHLPARPMQNLLLPTGIPKRDYAPRKGVKTLTNPTVKEDGRVILGTCGKENTCSIEGVMPDDVHSFLQTEKGVRRIQVDELAKAKGVPGEWRDKKVIMDKTTTLEATSIHILTAVCDQISEWFMVPENTESSAHQPTVERLPLHQQEEAYEWNYDYPNLEPNGKWYLERKKELIVAANKLEDPDTVIREGLEALEIHRANYTEAGPKFLQLLWWQFPEDHQEAVRRGSTMRFLIDPGGTEIVENPKLDPDQLEVCIKFVEELKGLGVLVPATRPLRRVCPLFVVPKPGQPGEWRCIADMRRGGQNEYCSADPIWLPSTRDILPHLYRGGWSAVADMSKYFHNFLTLPQEHELMGVIHPGTGEELWCRMCPMGSCNSPATACRIGEGALEDLRRNTQTLWGDTVIENTWYHGLRSGDFKAEWGQGRILLRKNGKPVAQVCGFVDDFFIHGIDQADCHETLNAFMDMTVRLGFICQKVKTSPPSQRQKFCGMIYDTTDIPTLRIPANKISRCIASAQYLLEQPREGQLSRLSLSVVTGVLQSIVDATPQHIGQTYLRSLYDDLHSLEEVGHLTGREYVSHGCYPQCKLLGVAALVDSSPPASPRVRVLHKQSRRSGS